jgi:hypothetical protein
MGTHDDVLRLNELLRPLAEGVLTVAKQTIKGGKRWTAVVLDVRYSANAKSFIDKTRVEYKDGTRSSVRLPAEVVMQLINLGNSRPQGKDRWYGMLLRVSPEGQCETQFNYDSHCAEDESFYDS